MKIRKRARRAGMSFAIILGWMVGAPFLANAQTALTFLHISDMHINPQPRGAAAPEPEARSVDAIGWICEEASKPQELTPLNKTVEPPAFVIATGDLTEYGVIHTTWEHFERYFEPLNIPLYLTPGNHDNTWTAMLSIMRERHGGDHYAFTEGGIHFISFETATPQEPVPSIDRRTLTWLEDYLKTVDRRTPVILFCHHPLSSGEFAKPYEQLRLLQLLDNHNVVLLLMGHGHSARHERRGRLDSVMGGSTFEPNTGYGIVRIEGDRLTVCYRYRDESRPMKVVLEKSIAPQSRLYDVRFSSAGIRRSDGQLGVEAGIEIRPSRNVTGGDEAQLTMSINGDEGPAVTFRKTIKQSDPPGRTTLHRERVPVEKLLPGRHYLRVHGDIGGEPVDVTQEFGTRVRSLGLRVERIRLDAGMKAGPLIVGEDIVLATTGGQVVRLSPGDDGWGTNVVHEAGVEILHAPGLAGNTLYVAAAEKGVLALDLEGQDIERSRLWTCDVGSVVYGTPVVDEKRVYVGDLEGNVHAIRRADGELIWSQHHATYSIEMPLVLHEDVLLFGAWDGFLYGVNSRDGSQVFKTRSPAGQEGGKFGSRYYAGGDCPPIVVGDHIVMADRAYRVGWYTHDGEYKGDLGEGIPAVAPTADGRGFYARGDASGLIAYDADGSRRWVAGDVKLGRFPIPPTVAGDRVYACSNHGLLHAVNAETGEVLWRYQVTPQLPVMAPVAATDDGVIVVVDMDGVVTRLVDVRYRTTSSE